MKTHVNQLVEDSSAMDAPMHVSVREAKLITERLLMLTGIDLGLVPAVRDFLLAAQNVGEPVFEFMDETLPDIVEAPPPHISEAASAGAASVIDCLSHPAMFVGPSLLDLVAERAETIGSTVVLVRNARFPGLLRGIVELANQHGLATTVTVIEPSGIATAAAGLGDPMYPVLRGALTPPNASAALLPNGAAQSLVAGDVLILASPGLGTNADRSEEPEALLCREQWHALIHGYKMEERLWWSLYHRSNEALTRPSEISRTHAGFQAGDRVEDPDWL